MIRPPLEKAAKKRQRAGSKKAAAIMNKKRWGTKDHVITNSYEHDAATDPESDGPLNVNAQLALMLNIGGWGCCSASGARV
jgi:hypothetical protein